MTGMEIFSLIEGIFSIVASIVSIITATYVFKIKNIIDINDSKKSGNSQKNIGIANKAESKSIIAGGNVNEK